MSTFSFSSLDEIKTGHVYIWEYSTFSRYPITISLTLTILCLVGVLDNGFLSIDTFYPEVLRSDAFF